MEKSLDLELELCGSFARHVLAGFKILAHKHVKIIILSKEKNSLKKKKKRKTNIFWNYIYSYTRYFKFANLHKGLQE